MVKKIMVLLMAVMLVIGLAACSSNKTGQSQGQKEEVRELVIADEGGNARKAYTKALYEAFEKEYNVKITPVNMDYGKFTAMIGAGETPEWDVVSVDADFVIRGGEKGLLEKLDYNIINTEKLLPGYASDYGLTFLLVPVSVAYNKDAFKSGKYPQNWADFWDTEEFPGSRAVWNYPTYTLEAALLADGVKPSELYPLDVDRAFKSLEKIKDDISVWWDTGAQNGQLLQTGEVAASVSYASTPINLGREGAPVGFSYNQAVLAETAWAVAKGSANKDLAMEFINFAIDSKRLAEVADIMPYPMTNPEYYDLVSEETKGYLPTPEETESFVKVDFNWWVENFDMVNERWQKFILE